MKNFSFTSLTFFLVNCLILANYLIDCILFFMINCYFSYITILTFISYCSLFYKSFLLIFYCLPKFIFFANFKRLINQLNWAFHQPFSKLFPLKHSYLDFSYHHFCFYEIMMILFFYSKPSSNYLHSYLSFSNFFVNCSAFQIH